MGKKTLVSPLVEKIRHGVEAKWVGRPGVPARRIAAQCATPVMATTAHHCWLKPACFFGCASRGGQQRPCSPGSLSMAPSGRPL